MRAAPVADVSIENSLWTIGRVAGYMVKLAGDSVIISRNGKEVVDWEVLGLGWYIDTAEDPRLGWAALPYFEVVYLFDAGRGGFGYAVNLGNPSLSEWGYNPFFA